MKNRAAVEGTTRIVGIFGDPVTHSLSPRMHNAAYAALGLDYVYVPLLTSERDLRNAVKAIRTLGLVGVNVTVPFKEKIMRYVDRLTPAAMAIGAINTIYHDGTDLVGANTDSPGIRASLKAAGFNPRRKRVLIIGAGGSARAAVHALTEAGAAEIVIANRTLRNAQKLTRNFGQFKHSLAVAPLDVLDDFDFLPTRQLVINCTPVGMRGRKFLDYDINATTRECLHFDLAYGEKPTPFLKLAIKAKRPTIDGRQLLLHQGAAAFKLFTGKRAPVGVMAKALGIRV